MDGLQNDAAAVLQTVFDRQKDAFSFAHAEDLNARRHKLERIENLIRTRQDDIVKAIEKDYGTRSSAETLSAEIAMTLSASKDLRKHLKHWALPRRVKNGSPIPGKAIIQPRPKGVVGVISPWNYPFQLAMIPLITAIAAGNHVMLKPSEFTPHTSKLFEDFFINDFDTAEIAVVTGGHDVGEAFSALPFDHLFYTGSTKVGRLVAIAAAKNLTPVTLELGGKSPCVILPDADIAEAAKTIAFGKFYNAGQTCVAPDYLLVPKDQAEKIGKAIIETTTDFYEDLATEPDYTSIINEDHYDRLNKLVSQCVSEGVALLRTPSDEQALKTKRKIAPTILLNPAETSAIMEDEIFGPLLPIIEYESVEEAIAFINKRDHPLALYVYGGGDGCDTILQSTTSGGACVNGTILHLMIENLPFGGVGHSGYGAYHGERGFREFSHDRAVFNLPKWVPKSLITPPYGKLFYTLLKKQMR